MKKSKNPSVRIKRAIKELSDANKYNLGNVLFEQIIAIGIVTTENELEKQKLNNKRSIIHPSLYEDVIDILRKHLDQIDEPAYTKQQAKENV